MGPTTTTGKKSQNDRMPSQKPEPVSCQASQPMAIRCIHIPTSETPLPRM